MKIQIDAHTLLRAKERGTTESEIIKTLESGSDIEAKRNRFGKAMIFPFNQIRNNKYYDEKKIEVYYVVEGDVIITVTVYVFFGNFGSRNDNLNLERFAI